MASHKYHQYFLDAHNFFNEKLFVPIFKRELPPIIITLSHRANARGYYWDGIFQDNSGTRMSELSICYNSLLGDTKTILSTFVHEEIHFLDHILGTNSKTPKWHGESWANYMLMVGLMPVSYDQPGKMIGRRVSHTIVDGGTFDKAATEFMGIYGELDLAQNQDTTNSSPPPKHKLRFSCPGCRNSLAAPKGLIGVITIMCNNCNQQMYLD